LNLWALSAAIIVSALAAYLWVKARGLADDLGGQPSSAAWLLWSNRLGAVVLTVAAVGLLISAVG
jgi:hypothetical protein